MVGEDGEEDAKMMRELKENCERSVEIRRKTFVRNKECRLHGYILSFGFVVGDSQASKALEGKIEGGWNAKV